MFVYDVITTFLFLVLMPLEYLQCNIRKRTYTYNKYVYNLSFLSFFFFKGVVWVVSQPGTSEVHLTVSKWRQTHWKCRFLRFWIVQQHLVTLAKLAQVQTAGWGGRPPQGEEPVPKVRRHFDSVTHWPVNSLAHCDPRELTAERWLLQQDHLIRVSPYTRRRCLS